MRTKFAIALLLPCALMTTSLAASALPTPLDEVTGTAPAMSAAQRLAQWQQLSAGQRAQLRAHYRNWRELSEAERASVRAAHARVAAMPPERAQVLHGQFQGMDRLYRDGWRLGPRLGAYYPQLQPLFGYVPAAQRAALLDVLRALDAEQLVLLARLAQRTPPQQRDALRNELLAQPATQRAAWLHARQAQ
jgi:hypothetical protein